MDFNIYEPLEKSEIDYEEAHYIICYIMLATCKSPVYNNKFK